MREARVLLVGMMGSGKTTVGRRLAERTGWPYLDNDELLARVRGRPTRELFEHGGVGALRSTESAVLHKVLATPPPIVASLAGGVVDRSEDRAAIAGAGFVVYLRADIETLVARVHGGVGRPWLEGDVAGALRRLYAGREDLYRGIANLVVDVDELTPVEVCERVLARLGGSGAGAAGSGVGLPEGLGS